MNRQDSLHDQLKTVYDLANKVGCYDAADFIKRHIDETERELIKMEKKTKLKRCPVCYKMKEDVEVRVDPYVAELYNREVEVRCCLDCIGERAGDI